MSDAPAAPAASRRIRDLDALLEVARALTALEQLDELLEVIIARASEVMDAERSTVFLYDPGTDELYSRAKFGEEGEIRFPAGAGIAGEVAESRLPANVPDAYEDPRFNAAFDQSTGYRTRSLLAAPLVTNSGKLIGVIEVLNQKGRGEFDLHDESLLEAFASFAAVAVERTQLTEARLEQERMEAGLVLARDIQMSMLPPPLPRDADHGAVEVAASIEPARAVGGDFYDYGRLHDGRIYFAIGDVADKGIAASLFMARAKTLVAAAARRALDPGAVLTEVNRELSPGNHTCTFVTLVCGVLDVETGALRLAIGGHDPPLLAAKEGEARFLDVDGGPMVGVVDDAAFPTRELSLAPGETLLLYTDGVTEATNGAELFGVDRLLAAARSLAPASPDELVSGVLASVESFCAGAAAADDITLVAVGLTSESSATSTAN